MEEIMRGKKRDIRQKGEREIRWKKEIMYVLLCSKLHN